MRSGVSYTDCKHHLFEPDHKLIVPSVKILQSLVSSHNHVAVAVLTDVLPRILEHLNTTQEVCRTSFTIFSCNLF